MSREAPCVLHVVALEDQGALEALRTTFQALALRGVDQLLLALDAGHEASRTLAGVVAAEMRRLHCAGLSVLGRIRALELEIGRLDRQRPLHVVHFHGMAPCLLGARALKLSPLRGRVLYSVHGTHFASPSAGALLRLLLQPRAPEMLPHAVSDVFFDVRKEEDRRPSVLAQGSVDIVTRLGVLLNGREARVRFSWLGAAGDGAAQLEAAHIPLIEEGNDLQRARSLSRAWLFLQLSPRGHSPLSVAQAMAAGVPCLVSDVPAHRALIRDGETGFLCASEGEVLEKLVLLMRDRRERNRIGEAARAHARDRFTARHLEDSLLRAYGLPDDGPAGGAAVH